MQPTDERMRRNASDPQDFEDTPCEVVPDMVEIGPQREMGWIGRPRRVNRQRVGDVEEFGLREPDERTPHKPTPTCRGCP
jgi:hypothetical protein